DDLFVCSASPYVDPREAIILAARKIAVWGADICILDCAGFSGWMKHLAKEVSGIPTISALSVSMRLAAEILS
ncbi:AroM family protein, partial [Synergistaceae bacterium OttesenSCG-928-I11]|nr:AroM family protein [Synergistaceae bacterium OttesenSCG-928-I11]